MILMNAATHSVPEFHTTLRATLNRRAHPAALALEEALAESIAASRPKAPGAPIRPYLDRQKAADKALRAARWAKAEADREAGV